MKVFRLEESKAGIVQLTASQADALTKAGQDLASKATYWGTDEESEYGSRKSVITCEHVASSDWRVRIKDAVGLVAVGDVQIEVMPKIPQSHLLYLFEKANYVPRIGEERALAAENQSLWKLVAQWFLTEAERVIRRDLMRDYQSIQDTQKLIRGRLDVINTTRLYYSGLIEFPCEFDEFTTDTSLNRILKTAARIISGSPVLDRSDRRRGSAVAARMDEVGDLELHDMRAQVSRSTAHYRDGVDLGRHIIRGHGRSITTGPEAAWTFLLRTPEAVEDGIRQILRQHLAGRWKIEKKGKQVTGHTMTLNPDLVFDDGLATGDVKYQLTTRDWQRGNLYQAIAFATIYRTNEAAVIGFRSATSQGPAPMGVGDMTIRHIDWVWDSATTPSESAALLVDRVDSWLSSLAPAKLQAS